MITFLRFLAHAAQYVAALLFAGLVLALRRLWPGFAAQMDEDDRRGP